MIDILPIQALLYMICVLGFGVSPIADPFLDHPDVRAAAEKARWAIVVGNLVVWIIYCIIGELSPWRGTLGKKIMGITVKSAYGGKLTARQIIVRNVAKILSAIPCYLGFYWALFTHGNRAWHDSLSKTAVTDR